MGKLVARALVVARLHVVDGVRKARQLGDEMPTMYIRIVYVCTLPPIHGHLCKLSC